MKLRIISLLLLLTIALPGQMAFSQDNASVDLSELSTSASTEAVAEVKSVVESDSVSLVLSATEDGKLPALPTLDPALGWSDQMVLLVRFAISNYKSLGGFGIASIVLLLLITLLNAPFTDKWFGSKSRLIKRLLITVFGQAVGFTTAMIGGAVWYEAIVTGFITSGGAVAIFEAAKAFKSS